MEQGSESIPSGSIDKTRVLNVRPLRCLVPVFPSQSGMPSFSTPQGSPFMCVPPTGPFPSGVSSFYPFSVPLDSQRTAEPAHGFNNSIASPVPLNSFRSPTAQYPGPANGDTGSSRRVGRRRRDSSVVDEDGYSDSQNQSDQYINTYGIHVNDAADSSQAGKKKSGKSQRRTRSGRQVNLSSHAVDIDSVIDNILASFNLLGLDPAKREDGDKELVQYVLLIYDVVRRRLTQIEDVKDGSGVARRPDLKTGASLMTKGIRTNARKRIGAITGVEVGDIFFFRMEMCLVGLHSPTMAGIDYMSVKVTMDEEPVAVSIVSSGGYEDDIGDGDVLIYSGQGGIQRRDKQMMDQKLERGNLALEKSLHRGNEVRVIRGLKDAATLTGKIYVYDGLYKIQESWVDKGKSGCNIFKYKLVRVPGQPEAFTMWKLIQQWKDGVASRVGTILPDLTSGAENLAVSLVNDVDDEKGPAYFTYIPSLKYSKPFPLPKPSLNCSCLGGCQPGDSNCRCIQKNEGYLPYSSLGVLLSYKSLIYECGPYCACPPNCRNRLSQAGLKARLEVFKTKDRGWGLRSWDPIRGGGFICEYAGEVIDKTSFGDFGGENDDNYVFDATRTIPTLENVDSVSDQSPKIPFPLVISAKNGGNVARFMNHSCAPNVFWQPVLRENGTESFLHIAFFAIRHIPPMQELTFNYGTVQSDRSNRRKKNCLCGSSKCRGYFY